MNNKVLIVEEDQESALKLQKTVRRGGYEAVVAGDGQEGIELFRKGDFNITITDLEMPVMSGREFIKNLKRTGKQTAIIVLTGNKHVNAAVDTIKLGIFDYVIKPFEENDLLLKIKQGLDYARLRSMELNYELENAIRMEKQLNWSTWKNDQFGGGRDKFDNQLFHNLRVSFSQGSGFGAMLGLVASLPGLFHKNGKVFEINAETMGLLSNNADIARRAIDAFLEIDDASNHTFQFDSLHINELFNMFGVIQKDLESKRNIQKHRFIINKPHPEHEQQKVRIDRTYFPRAITELYINALKFSPPESNIYTVIKTAGNNLILTILNSPSRIGNTTHGIPEEYHRMLFEPFFKLSNQVDDKYQTMDFGLGLTLAKKILNKHLGYIEFSNIHNFNFQDDTHHPIKIAATIEMPLLS